MRANTTDKGSVIYYGGGWGDAVLPSPLTDDSGLTIGQEGGGNRGFKMPDFWFKFKYAIYIIIVFSW